MTTFSSLFEVEPVQGGVLVPVLQRGRGENLFYRSTIGLRSEPASSDELRPIFRKAAEQGMPVVFPSHFLEHADADEILRETRSAGALWRLQLTAGAELSELDFPVTAIDLCMDRPLTPTDHEKILELRNRGVDIRLVFCPTRLFRPDSGILLLPSSLLGELTIFFCPKSEAWDSFLDEDEIFLFLRELHRRRPDLAIRVLSYLSEHDLKNAEARENPKEEFRKHPSASAYDRAFAELGQRHRFRRWIRLLGASSLSRGVLILFYSTLLFVETPAGAIRNFSGNVKRIAILGYWSAYSTTQRCLERIRRAGNYLCRWARNPVWMIRTETPKLYDISLRPLLQCLWSIRYHLQSGDLIRWMTSPVKRAAVTSSIRVYWACAGFTSRTIGHMNALRIHFYWSVVRIGTRSYWRARALLSRAKTGAYWTFFSMSSQLRGRAVALSVRIFWIAVNSCKIAVNSCKRVYWTSYSLGSRLYWLAWSKLSQLRWRIMVFCARTFWFLWHALAHPVWTLRTHLPWAYWVLIFPFQKAYWFTEFQVRTRLLRRS